MAGSLNRLSDRTVKTVDAGMHCDGGGLYLQVTAGKEEGQFSRSWLFRFATGEVRTSRTGKARKVERAMGLGSYPDVSLAAAREKAADARRLREQGVIDPIKHRDTQTAAAAAVTAKTITFQKAAEKYIASHEVAWRNAKHRQQWTNTLKTYAYPIIGHLAARDIDTGLVMQILEPIWTIKPETAGRVRGRIERVLQWCKINGYREGWNPARWIENLDQLLPKLSKVRKVKHHPALPYEQMAAFMAELREQEGTAARALEFTILTAARSGESRGMPWEGELNTTNKVWSVPPHRMKGERQHRVPLTAAALAIIESMRETRRNEYVFPGDVKGEPLSDMALTEVIRRMNEARTKAGLPRWVDPKRGGRDVVPHGFRSTFRDWVSEVTEFPDALGEAAIAHVKGDKVEAAYKRGDLFEKRRILMNTWSDYCISPTTEQSNVTPIRQVS
jgi:integrase